MRFVSHDTGKHAQTWVSRTKTDHHTKQQNQYMAQFGFFFLKSTVNT